jgi:hypothetical protein
VEGGRIFSAEGECGCVLNEFAEKAPEWMDVGPSWSFRGRCDLSTDRPAWPGSPNGSINGTIELAYPAAGSRDRTQLKMRIDRPPIPGVETGLWALYTSTMYGPYVRCD